MSTQLLALINVINDSPFSIEHESNTTPAARDALKTLKTAHPKVYAFVTKSMTRAVLGLDVLEDQGYTLPKGYSWRQVFAVVADAQNEAHGN